MDKQVLLLLIIVVIVTICILYPNFFGMFREGFDEKKVNNPSTLHNPKEHQPELNNEIDRTPLVGLPSQMIPAWESDSLRYGDFDGLNDGADGNMGMGFNLCSKSCCSTQYPTPFGLPVDPLVCGSKQEFVPSTYTCNNGWQDGGCLCMTKEQALFLNTRGNNA